MTPHMRSWRQVRLMLVLLGLIAALMLWLPSRAYGQTLLSGPWNSTFNGFVLQTSVTWLTPGVTLRFTTVVTTVGSGSPSVGIKIGNSGPVTYYTGPTYVDLPAVEGGEYIFASNTGYANYLFTYHASTPLVRRVIDITIPANPTERTIKYRLYKGETVVGEYDSPPGDTSHRMIFDVEDNDQYRLARLDEGLSMDGPVWVLDDEAVHETTLLDELTPTEYPEGTPDESIPMDNNKSADTNNAVPNSGKTTEASKSVWTAAPAQTAGAQTNLLTIPTYREGVDKVVAAINGTSEPVQEFDKVTTVTTSLTSTQVTGMLTKLPAAPAMPAVSTTNSYTGTLPVPMLPGQTFTFKMDLEPFGTSVNVAKTIIRFFMGVILFLAIVKAWREGFA